MPLLMLFALLAGAGTAITPRVLPVLPALLSASAVGGRRRPLGIVVGLASTFTIAIVALAQLVTRASLGERGSANARDRRAVRIRHCAADPGARRTRAGAAFAPGSFRPPHPRNGLLVGGGRRRSARLRVRALCRSDPRRGHVRQRVERRVRTGRGGRGRLFAWTERGDAAVRVGRASGGRAHPPLGSRPHR